MEWRRVPRQRNVHAQHRQYGFGRSDAELLLHATGLHALQSGLPHGHLPFRMGLQQSIFTAKQERFSAAASTSCCRTSFGPWGTRPTWWASGTSASATTTWLRPTAASTRFIRHVQRQGGLLQSPQQEERVRYAQRRGDKLNGWLVRQGNLFHSSLHRQNDRNLKTSREIPSSLHLTVLPGCPRSAASSPVLRRQILR